MWKNIKKRLKNQRGVTLVELLAVMVILGIIAAIAVPNIGGIIDKSKKDAHLANAQQIVNAAKIYVTSEKSFTTGNVTLDTLVTGGYLEQINDPTATTSGATYDGTLSFVTVGKVGNKYTYTITLAASGGTPVYISNKDPFGTGTIVSY